MVTFLDTGTPSFNQITSGHGEAYKENEKYDFQINEDNIRSL